MKSYCLKTRGGSPTYMTHDGKTRTAGKGALHSDEHAFTIGTSQDQTLLTDTGGEWVARRLTPTECERLQGFPDGYTDIPYRGKEHAPDTQRIKALGNSFAVPVIGWIGARIQAVEDAMN